MSDQELSDKLDQRLSLIKSQISVAQDADLAIYHTYKEFYSNCAKPTSCSSGVDRSSILPFQGSDPGFKI